MTFGQIDSIIQSHINEFKKPGVLSVRPGYKFTGGWITKKPAIVVVVDKKGDVPAPNAIPTKVAGVAVDVREATPLQRLRHTDPAKYAAIATRLPPELAESPFSSERDVATGTLVATVLMGSPQVIALAGKPKLDYKPPAGVSLQPVTGSMSVTCHASPDAGWPTLEEFFKGIADRLTVGMYDFTSAHILETLEESLSGGHTLSLVLDRPAKNPSADQTDDETRNDIAQKLTTRAKTAWALVRSNPTIADWIFPTAYHIKVAVRDGTAFWLSSGNWNNSNQPDIDPVNHPNDIPAGTLQRSDRDWHVIVENAALAATFEAYLKNDMVVAGAHQGAPAANMVGLPEVSLDDLVVIAAASPVPKEYFAPLRITNEQMTIEPILTPDNYAPAILGLLRSATKTLYMQTQYIHPPGDGTDAAFQELIAALVTASTGGLDVRLIMSQYEAMGDWLERLQTAGIDMATVRIQAGVHNKGIVVDSSVVAIGSHNWSGDGTLRNRDATVIVHHAGAAKYFEKIFVHDWTKMARQQV